MHGGGGWKPSFKGELNHCLYGGGEKKWRGLDPGTSYIKMNAANGGESHYALHLFRRVPHPNLLARGGGGRRGGGVGGGWGGRDAAEK